MFYSNKPVYLERDVDRRSYSNNDETKRNGPNLTYRLAQLKDYIFENHVYRISLSLIVDLGLVNFSVRINITLERNMNK